MKIQNKKHFYSLALDGLVGNTPMCWKSFKEYELEREQYPIVTFRSFELGKFKDVKPWMTGEEVDNFISSHEPETYIIMEAPNYGLDNKYGLQGEFTWIDGAWTFYYTLKLGYMREKLDKYGKHCFGQHATNLIKEHASPSGFYMLMELFNKYTEGNSYPVIEFAVLPRSVGRYKMDTLIWEIRNGY